MDNARTTIRLIREAYRALNRKRFSEAIVILEKVLAGGYGDSYVLLLLSVGYLCTDQFGKLARFITKLKEKSPHYLPLTQLEAFLKLKAAATREEALALYLDLEERYPADPHIQRGRRLIAGTDDFGTLQKEAKLNDFVYIPRPPRDFKKTRNTAYMAWLGKKRIKIYRTRRWVWGILSAFAVAIAAVMAGWGIARMAGNGRLGIFSDDENRPKDLKQVDMVTVSGMDYDLVRTVKPDAVPVYYRSAKELTSDFNRARLLIKQGKYNSALYILNGISQSNVNFSVREKVEFLIRFVISQEERDYEAVPFSHVGNNAYRYLGYAVRWRGIVDAIKRRGEGQKMVMEAAWDGQRIQIDVYSPKPLEDIKKGTAVIVDGVITGIIGKEKRIYITAHEVTRVK